MSDLTYSTVIFYSYRMKKNSVITNCPIDTTVNVLKGRCKAGIVKGIYEGANRFGQIKRITNISDKLLARQLNELEQDQIIVKQVLDNNPLQVYYSLTEEGKNLQQVIIAMENWGRSYGPYQAHQFLVEN